MPSTYELPDGASCLIIHADDSLEMRLAKNGNAEPDDVVPDSAIAIAVLGFILVEKSGTRFSDAYDAFRAQKNAH